MADLLSLMMKLVPAAASCEQSLDTAIYGMNSYISYHVRYLESTMITPTIYGGRLRSITNYIAISQQYS